MTDEYDPNARHPRFVVVVSETCTVRNLDGLVTCFADGPWITSRVTSELLGLMRVMHGCITPHFCQIARAEGWIDPLREDFIRRPLYVTVMGSLNIRSLLIRITDRKYWHASPILCIFPTSPEQLDGWDGDDLEQLARHLFVVVRESGIVHE